MSQVTLQLMQNITLTNISCESLLDLYVFTSISKYFHQTETPSREIQEEW